MEHEEEEILEVEKKLDMNTSDIDEIIKDYLNAKKTDYAIMISGEWGSGKSHYLTHEFKLLVEGVVAPKEDDLDKKKGLISRGKEIHYSPAFISLYGVSSVEDFEVRVFSGVNSWTNKGFFRVAGLVGSKVGDFFGVSTGKKDAKAITFIRKNRVLVFDDLERICEDKISVKEVMGLINSYAEQSNYKVIIVCNENVYLSEDVDEDVKESYTKYKEKSVRFTYKFIPDVGVVYDIMVSKVPDIDYKAFLISEKDSILHLFDLGGEKNLRTLKFFIDTFGKIYSLVKTTKYHQKINRAYLVAFMLYSCEHKHGHQTKELDSLDNQRYRLNLSGFLGTSQEDDNLGNKEKKDFITVFQEKYSSVYSEFKPNKLFIDYIATGCLDVEKLKREIDNLDAEFDRLVVKAEGKVYQRLLRMTELNDGEAISLINEMMSYLKADKYSLYDILQIYALLLKYDYWTIEGFELTDALDKEFQEAMQRQEANHQFNDLFEIKTPIFDNDGRNKRQYEKYKTMKDAAKEINWQVKKRMNEAAGNEFIKTAENGEVDKLRAYRMDENKRVPISGLDMKRIADLIKNASNPIACELCECIISFIPGKGYLQSYEEACVKTELLPALEECLANDKNTIRKIYITELSNYLIEVIR